MKFASEKEFEDELFKLLEKMILDDDFGPLDEIGLDVILPWIDDLKVPDCTTIISAHRQPRLTGYGILDILIYHEHIYMEEPDDKNNISSQRWKSGAIIIELKNEPIVSENINQVCRYKTGLEQLDGYDSVKAILIGPSVQTGDFIINNLQDDVCVFTYEMGMLGITFTEKKHTLMVSHGSFNDFMDQLEFKAPSVSDQTVDIETTIPNFLQ